jgi:hypothetical protein
VTSAVPGLNLVTGVLTGVAVGAVVLGKCVAITGTNTTFVPGVAVPYYYSGGTAGDIGARFRNRREESDMIVFISVVAFVVASVLSYAQVTRGRTVASFAVGGQLVGIVGLLLGEDYYRPLALFIVGTLVGAAAAAASHRGRLRAR